MKKYPNKWLGLQLSVWMEALVDHFRRRTTTWPPVARTRTACGGPDSKFDREREFRIDYRQGSIGQARVGDP